MNRDLLYLPKNCYAILPRSGELVTITRGRSGYQHSPLDKGNRTENRIIADRENTALGGVTAEQEKDMVDGAIFGWEIILYRNGALFPKDKILQVEISNGGPKSYETSVTLELPATWAEFHDALEKARIKDARHCKNEVLSCRYKPLTTKLIGCNVNLLELNLLAQRLAMLTDDDRFGFEGLIKIEQAKTSGAIPLPRLINLTFNTDQCCVAAHVFNPRELGQLLWDSEMLPDEAMALLDQAEPDSEYRNSLLAVFGKKHMDDEGGVITSRGYVEMSGEIREVYVPGEMAYFERSAAPVVLKVRKGFFNDPAYDNDLTATLDLPAYKETVWRAVEAVEAASADECGFRCVDCLIPAARELINDAIDKEGGIEQADAFARLLSRKERVWTEADIVKYKALLEASGCAGLEDAMALAEELDQYDLLPEIAEPWDYAQARLREKYPDLPTVLFRTGQAYQAGMEMLEQDHAALTDYGILRRKDGHPLPELGLEAGGMTQRME